MLRQASTHNAECSIAKAARAVTEGVAVATVVKRGDFAGIIKLPV
jgi:hypothetical protein